MATREPVKKTLKEFSEEAAAANGASPDREQELADMEAAGMVADDSGESDHLDDEPAKKERVPMTDYEKIGWSDHDEAINIIAVFDGYSEKKGALNVNVLFDFTAPSDSALSAQLTPIAGTDTAFTFKYAGRDFGIGATIEQFIVRGTADPDTNVMKFRVRLPENQRAKLKNAVGLADSRGVVALTPLQLTVDLTTRQE